jgi:hypothetical protein
MTQHRPAIWLAGLMMLMAAVQASAQTGECVPTPRRDVLPDVIAPMAGDEPIWFIDGGGGAWAGPDAPVKSVWVLARRVSGALVASGRQLDGPNAIRFRIGLDGPRTDGLHISDPVGASMTPGSASPELMKRLAFVSSYIFYPAPGCWEIQTQLGTVHRSVVVQVK